MVRGLRGLCLTVVGVVIVVLLGACGSSSSSSYAKQAPAKILSDAAGALGGASSYEATGVVPMGGAKYTATLAVAGTTRYELSLAHGSTLVKALRLSSQSYIYASPAFWQKEASSGLTGAELKRLANKWFTVPTANAGQLTGAVSDVTPKQLAACLTRGFTKPTVNGTATQAGQSTVVLHTSGNAATGPPADLYVSASSPHYPLRFVQLGGQEGGGNCSSSLLDNDGKGYFDFSSWNTVKLSAPAGATALPGS
jgi:hypothetical protein